MLTKLLFSWGVNWLRTCQPVGMHASYSCVSDTHVCGGCTLTYCVLQVNFLDSCNYARRHPECITHILRAIACQQHSAGNSVENAAHNIRHYATGPVHAVCCKRLNMPANPRCCQAAFSRCLRRDVPQRGRGRTANTNKHHTVSGLEGVCYNRRVSVCLAAFKWQKSIHDAAPCSRYRPLTTCLCYACLVPRLRGVSLSPCTADGSPQTHP